MAFGTRVSFEAVRELAFGAISGTYAALGVPLTNNARLVSFQNSTDVAVYISFDGSTDHLRMATNSFKLLDLSSNKVRDDGLFIASGTQIWVKQVSSGPSSGTVWAEVLIAAGGK